MTKEKRSESPSSLVDTASVERVDGRTSSSKAILRWAGSKRKLVPKITTLFPQKFRRYIEPFAGSACVFAALAPKKAVLSDINAELIHTYQTLATSAASVHRALRKWDLRKKTYYEVRSLDPKKLKSVRRAARFIYLNRRCFNGVFRLNKEGRFNVPLGRKTGPLPSRRELLEFSSLLAQAEIRACDFEKTVKRAGNGDLVYLDPPYTAPGTRFRGEYGWNAFREVDEERLIRSVQDAATRGATVVLSYRGSVAKRLPGWRRKHVRVLRSVSGFSAKRRRVTEVLFTSGP